MAAHQAPPSLGFSRQEHWSGLPFPSPVCESELAQSCVTHNDPMDRSLPGSSSMRFSRQEYWTGLPSPSLIQPWCTSFPIWKKSVVPCPVLTVASWSAYRFLKRQVRWSGIPISLGISLLWFTQSKSLHSQWSRRSRFFFFFGVSLPFLWSRGC